MPLPPRPTLPDKQGAPTERYLDAYRRALLACEAQLRAADAKEQILTTALKMIAGGEGPYGARALARAALAAAEAQS